jgi:hypothetical protein
MSDAQQPSTALEPVPPTYAATYVPELVLDPSQAALLADQVRDMTRAVLVDGVDYGPPWPGQQKKVLLKPGAERLAQWFGLGVELRRGETIMDPRKNTRVGVYASCRLTKRGAVTHEVERYAGRDESKFAKAPWDTIVAMAEKRALVAAIRIATGTSGLFDEEGEGWDARAERDPEHYGDE